MLKKTTSPDTDLESRRPPAPCVPEGVAQGHRVKRSMGADYSLPGHVVGQSPAARHTPMRRILSI